MAGVKSLGYYASEYIRLSRHNLKNIPSDVLSIIGEFGNIIHLSNYSHLSKELRSGLLLNIQQNKPSYIEMADAPNTSSAITDYALISLWIESQVVDIETMIDYSNKWYNFKLSRFLKRKFIKKY